MAGLTGMGTVAEMPYLWHTVPVLVVSQLLMGIEVTGCGSSSALGKSYFLQLTVF
jgi:hypothetical protein